MLKKFFPVVMFLLCVGLCGCTSRANIQHAQKAMAAAKEYLGYIDNAQYAESWDKAGSIFQQTVTRADWDASLKKSRAPLGKVVARGLRARQFTHFINYDAPRGNYVILTFRTSYEKKADFVEIITLLEGFNGKWEVVGFFIV